MLSDYYNFTLTTRSLIKPTAYEHLQDGSEAMVNPFVIKMRQENLTNMKNPLSRRYAFAVYTTKAPRGVQCSG
uniref:Uncharacterized protein n=1 Tax=Romanomermis culicivorax TaxID=13658 RepID=A0A915HSV9_ROMCU